MSPATREIFAHFQNLNLLVLLEDLRVNRAARGAWSKGGFLCPVAHGLSAGQQVQRVKALGQITEFGQDCFYAAESLGANPGLVSRFVQSWDEQAIGSEQLLRQLEELWRERLQDADAVQAVLEYGVPKTVKADRSSEFELSDSLQR
jgi:hypothetical protein